MSPVILKANNISKRFEIYLVRKTLFRLAKTVAQRLPLSHELWALHRISLEVRQGDKIAVIGRNGSGKTTLFRLLSGIYAPTEGTIEAACPVRPLFRYGMGMNPQMTVLDNIFLIGSFYGLSVPDIRNRMETILAFSELDKLAYVPVKNLSAGQIGRLTFSVFIQNQEDFLAFDESTAMADNPFQAKMGSYFSRLMADETKTVLMASHNLNELRRYCKTAIWLESGQIARTGPVDEVASAYEEFCAAYSKTSGREPDREGLVPVCP